MDILFVACFDCDKVLVVIYGDSVHIQWIRKISYSPLESFIAIFPGENGLEIVTKFSKSKYVAENKLIANITKLL